MTTETEFGRFPHKILYSIIIFLRIIYNILN